MKKIHKSFIYIKKTKKTKYTYIINENVKSSDIFFILYMFFDIKVKKKNKILTGRRLICVPHYYKVSLIIKQIYIYKFFLFFKKYSYHYLSFCTRVVHNKNDETMLLSKVSDDYTYKRMCVCLFVFSDKFIFLLFI